MKYEQETWKLTPYVYGGWMKSRQYEVSTEGRLRDFETKEILTPIEAKDGYLKFAGRYVHLLVAHAFLPKPNYRVLYTARCKCTSSGLYFSQCNTCFTDQIVNAKEAATEHVSSRLKSGELLESIDVNYTVPVDSANNN